MAEAKGETHSISINGEMITVKQMDSNQLIRDLQTNIAEQFTEIMLPKVLAIERAFVEFTLAMRNVAADLSAAFEASQEGEWWKNGSQPPLYKHSINAPEWWQRGEEPPMFDLAG